MHIRNKAASLLLAFAMLVGLMPWAALNAWATSAEPVLSLGVGGVKNGDTVWFGTKDSAPIQWRVLSALGDTTHNSVNLSDTSAADEVLLIRKYLLWYVYFKQYSSSNSSNEWAGSDAQAFCTNLYSDWPDGAEKAAIKATTITETEGYTGGNGGSIVYNPVSVAPPAGANGNFFFLSAKEADNYFAGNNDRKAYESAETEGNNSASYWWLRSPNANSNVNAGVVRLDGLVDAINASNGIGGRPAFNLNPASVLFASAAADGKALSAAGAIETISTGNTTDWKLTLLDGTGHSGFAVTEDTATVAPGGTVSLTYSGAATGTKEYVSVLLCNAAGTTALGYGSGAALTAASGTATFTIPADLATGTYTLKVFNEQKDADASCDYASAFDTVTLTVAPPGQVAAPTFSPAAGAVTSGAAVTISCATAGATIHYTIGENPGDPTTLNTVYTEPITITQPTTIKAIAVKNGMTGSAVASAAYTIAPPREATPTAAFTATGTDSGTLSGVTSGMKYSLDGTNWTDISSSADIALTGLSACTISVVKKGNGTTTSDSAAQTIAVTQAAKPTTGLGTTSCTTAANNDGTITGLDSAKTYEYKTTGAYAGVAAGSTSITGLASGTYYVRVKASGTVLASPDSDALTVGAYTPPGQVAAPTFSPAAGAVTSGAAVTISCSTAGATIHYAIGENPGDPTTLNTIYTEPITITQPTTIKAIAVKDGMTDSAVASAAYTIAAAPTYTVTVTSGTGGGSHTEGDSVTITADAPASGKQFKEWAGADGLTFTSGGKTSASATFTMPARNVTLTATYKSASSSNSGSDSRSHDYTPSPTTETVVNADGSTTKTITNPDGSKTAVTTAKDGSVTTVKNDKNGNLVSVEAAPSATAIEAALRTGVPIRVPVTVSIVGATSIQITLPTGLGSGRVADMPRVEIEVSVTGPSVVAMEKAADGTLTPIRECCEGSVIFPVTGSGKFVIVDNAKAFNDVSATDWYSEYVTFVTAREIFNGTGNGSFSPNGTMTRAMLAQVLYNFARGAKAGDGTVFDDVSASDWFNAAVGWAYENKVVTGYGDRFGAQNNITRQDMATILYRYAKAEGYDVSATASLDKFSDASDAADYAADAMRWAVGAGLISGMEDGTLNPTGSATRAQVATIMTRFVRSAK